MTTFNLTPRQREIVRTLVQWQQEGRAEQFVLRQETGVPPRIAPLGEDDGVGGDETDLLALEAENLVILRHAQYSTVVGLRQRAFEAVAGNFGVPPPTSSTGAWELPQANQSAEHLDALTELPNYGAFVDDVGTLLELSKSEAVPVSCLMIDINDFKALNETYGHPIGNKALHAVASELATVVRGKGRAYRYGGDEFAALLPNFSAEEAHGLSERLRKRLASLHIEGIDRHITLTVGVACCPDIAATPEDLTQRADDALRAGKRLGKDRTVVYESTAVSMQGQTPLASPEEIDKIINWFESPEAHVRVDAVRELHGLARRRRILHHEPLRGAIGRLFSDPDESVRLQALHLVGALMHAERGLVGRRFARSILKLAESDPSPTVRAQTMSTIGLTGDSYFLDHVLTNQSLAEATLGVMKQ